MRHPIPLRTKLRRVFFYGRVARVDELVDVNNTCSKTPMISGYLDHDATTAKSLPVTGAGRSSMSTKTCTTTLPNQQRLSFYTLVPQDRTAMIMNGNST